MKSERLAQGSLWAVCFIIAAATFPFQKVPANEGVSTTKPNIILMVTDDQGYADVGFRGSPIKTPNMDRLAKNGVVLERFYTCPVCSPTRAGLMTGRYPIRFGMQRAVNRPNSLVGLPVSITTLPEALQDAGYEDRHIVGKWHLGNMKKSQLPLSHGFTTQYGPYCSGIGYFDHRRLNVPDFHRDQKTIKEVGYYTDLLSDEAVRIIKRHQKRSPFFMYLPYGAPHMPLQAPKDQVALYEHLGNKRKATYAAMVSVIDQGLGRILEALEDTGQADNTLIVMISDNGGQANADNTPLRGRKGTLYEGGIRVVAVASWPGHIPAGSVCKQQCCYLDLLPTFLDAADFAPEKLSEELDGRSVLSLWKATEGGVKERGFYSFYETRKQENLSVIEGDWKLIRRGKPILETDNPSQAEIELFDLSKDIDESNNLATSHPDRVRSMLEKLIEFRKLRPDGGVPPMVEPFPTGWNPPKDWEPTD